MGAMTSSMPAKFAFFPPNPPSYGVEEEGGWWWCEEAEDDKGGDKIRHNADILRLRTKRGNDVVVVYIREPSASMTLLYSHGRSEEKVGRQNQKTKWQQSSI